MHHALVLLANCEQARARLNRGYDTCGTGTEVAGVTSLHTRYHPLKATLVGTHSGENGNISPKVSQVSAVVDLGTSQIT